MRALCIFLLSMGLSWPTAADEAKAPSAILLVARGGLPDPFFRDSVVLVMNNIGPAPVGVIVNRPTKFGVSHLFPDVERLAKLDDRVYFGGPVEIDTVSFLIRAETPPERAARVMDGVYLAADKKLLDSLLRRDKPMDGLRIFAGHASWAPGQLEAEIARGDWTLVPAKPDAIFEPKSEHPWPEPTTPEGARRT